MDNNGWYILEKTKPQESLWCLVSCEGAVNCLGWNNNKQCFEDWCYNNSGCLNVHPDEVTHWRPIPDPPVT